MIQWSKNSRRGSILAQTLDSRTFESSRIPAWLWTKMGRYEVGHSGRVQTDAIEQK